MQGFCYCSTVRHGGTQYFRLREDVCLASSRSEAVAVRLPLDPNLHTAAGSFASRSWRRSNHFFFPHSGPVYSRRWPMKVAASLSNVPVADEQRISELAKKVTRAVLSAAIAFGIVVFVRSGSAIASTNFILADGSSATAASSGTAVLLCAWMGLMSGCLHTLTGPDHLAALAPLSIGRSSFESLAVGALWGFGHDAGQVMFGVLFLLLKDKLHIEILRIWGARVVALTLLTIGVTGIMKAHEISVPCVAGNASAITNTLPPSEPLKGTKKNVGLATFATGIVHGLQPDALLMILPAVALPSRFAGGAFLSMFLLGTVLAMGGYTAFIGSCSHALERRVPRVTEHLSWVSSVVALFVGAAILVGESFGLAIF